MDEISQAKFILDIHKNLLPQLKIDLSISNKHYHKVVETFLLTTYFQPIQFIQHQE